MEAYQERHGNWKLRPVSIEAAVKAGEVGLAGLLAGSRRHRVELEEYARDGSVLRKMDLGKCRVKRYRCAPHDAMSSMPVMESVVVHPERLRVRNLVNPDFVEPHPVAGGATEVCDG
jgi:hypothetical protein